LSKNGYGGREINDFFMDDTFKNKEILAIRNKTDLQHYFGGLNIFKPLLI
jgi:hypothetical protein